MSLSLFGRSKPVCGAASTRGAAASTPDTEPFSPTVPALPPQPQAQRAGLVTYSWLLDPRKQIIGYRLRWQPRAGAAADDGQALQALVTAVADALVHRERGWLLGKSGLMFDMTLEAALRGIDWGRLPARNIVLCWSGADFGRPEALPLLQALRAEGFGIMVSGELPDEAAVRELITHFDVGTGDAAALATCRSIARRPVHPVATGMADWSGFDACASRRVPVLVPPAVPTPQDASPRGPLQPQTLLVVRLLQMVQRNEDVREIEAALKHDAALTYRLLHHINSPAVGAGVQIQSLRHAVAMLGYSRLFRWLSVLLMTTDVKSSPPFLMKKAIVRGRFVELLGQGLLGAKHADNLFLVGMFSVMDQLLRLSMTELLERVQLEDAVQLAILGNGGVYGPFLELALACEAGAERAGDLVDGLFMSESQANAAHLAAVTWAQEISRSEVT